MKEAEWVRRLTMDKLLDYSELGEDEERAVAYELLRRRRRKAEKRAQEADGEVDEAA